MTVFPTEAPIELSYYLSPWGKSEALQLGVHFILLYFIRNSLLITETFFLFCWWVVGPTFKSLGVNMVYTLGIYLDI